MTFNPNAVTIGQLEQFEAITGKTMTQALDGFEGGLPPALDLVGLAWLATQITPTPKTVDEVRNLSIGELLTLIDMNDEVADANPESPAPEPGA